MAQDLPDDPDDLIFSDREEQFQRMQCDTHDSHGFSVRPGGNAKAAAERIGSAVGSAERQVRRGLELVRPYARRAGFPFYGSEIGQPGSLEQEGLNLASRMMQAFEEEVAATRRQAAQIGTRVEARIEQFRDSVRDAVSRTGVRTRELAQEHPVETIAAIAGVCFACGVALGRKSNRR
jgi:ElaB/YqjD/DUF883 family membrane-anchored ribosome-binding protein